jgi:hypothetical protein
MNKRILFLYLTLYLTSNISAQSDFRKGFIVMNSGDTINGLIDFRGDISNSERCIFKVGENVAQVEYNPQEIKGYRFIDSKFYISKTISIKDKESQVFLEYLLNGIVDLFSYKNMDGLYFFMQKEGGPLVEINEPEVVTYVNGNVSTVRTDKKYIGRLKYTFSDAPEMAGEIEKVTPDRKSLIRISKKYHEQVCKDDQCIVYEKKLHIAKINIGPIIGVRILSIIPEKVTFGSPMFPQDFYDCDFEVSNTICYGLFCNFSLPVHKGKLLLQYEGMVSSNTFSSQFIDEDYFSTAVHDFSLNSTDLSHYLFVRYDFSKSRLHPLVQAGGFVNQKLKLEKTGFDLYEYQADIFPKVTYPGFSIGLGVAYQINEKKEATLKVTYSSGYGSFIYLNTQEINFTLAIPVFQFKLD